MRNPSRTPQNSIFEPLFSQEEELHTPPTHLIHSSSSEWLSSTYSSASPSIDHTRAFPNNQIRKAPTTILNQDMSTNQGAIKRKHSNLASRPERYDKSEPIACSGKSSPSISTDIVLGRSTSQSTPPPPCRSLSSGYVNNHDDGSVASKLLTSITKSISSPSLLSCCKEAVRETPYQKTLRLRMMKLQHCAEELGSESSDGALIYGAGSDNNSFGSFSMIKNGSSQSSSRSSFARSLIPPTTPQKVDPMSECNDASPMMISVRSAPNLTCPSLVGRHTSQMKERSFPPPLITHTLQRSASSDSFALSLRPCREDGRFMLKEVRVPCWQYLRASRKDGRLTLQILTSDEGIEQEESADKEMEYAMESQQDKHVVNVDEGTVIASLSSGYKARVESLHELVDVEGELKGNAKIDDVHMDEFQGDISKLASICDTTENGGLSAKSLFTATGNTDSRGMADDDTHLGVSHVMKSKDTSANNGPSPNYLPNLSSTTHDPPDNNYRLKVVSPLVTLAPCEENMVLQSSSALHASDPRVKSMLGLEISSASLQGAQFSMDRRLSSTIIFKDVGANSLMENVAKLVNSFGLDGGKWCQGKVEYSRALERRGVENCQLKDSSGCGDGIRSINFGMKKAKGSGAHTTNGIHILNVECERKSHDGMNASKGDQAGTWIDINTGGVSTKSTMLQFNVQLPLQLDWLHNLHCKELFDRNNFVNKGFPCVAIRS